MLNSTIFDGLFEGDIFSLSLSENTRIAYNKGWRVFNNFCFSRNIEPLQASHDDLADFFIFLSSVPRSSIATIKQGEPLSLGTLTIYKSAIASNFNKAGLVSPTNSPKVNAVLKCLARYRGEPPRRVKALRDHHIIQMLQHCEDTLIGKRDAAILAVGFAGALRRSEICNLKLEDIEVISPTCGLKTKKMFITIRKSKTDQFRKSFRIAVPDGKRIKPINKLQTWIADSGITHGHLFQTMRRGGAIRGKQLHHSDIPRLVKKYAKAIGINPIEVSGHSLRAGFVTSAAVHNARLDKIMEITRHTNPSTVIKYIRDADIFRDHAGENFL